jgi:hypothetical protein
VRKTFGHGAVTLAHGHFDVRETEYFCPRGCQEQSRPGQAPRPVVRRSAPMAQLLPPRCSFGYDVMALAGRQRFVDHRRRDEVRCALAQEHGIRVSEGEVGVLERRFLVYLERLHQLRAPRLGAAMQADGGWPLHVDATGENGRGTLLVAYAGWRGWVLGAWKIPTERADAVEPRLHEVERLFGAPCAVMRDLGKAVIEATRDFVGGRSIPVLGCHMHLAKDVGRDLLEPGHDALRDEFRRLKTLPRLRELVRDLGRRLGALIGEARAAVRRWAESAETHPPVPQGVAGIAVVRALGQWTLDFPAAGTDAGFPFDRPWLDLHARCLRVCRAAESLLDGRCADGDARRALERLHRIVEQVRAETAFARPLRAVGARAALFDELRDALRVGAKSPQQELGIAADPQRQEAELRDVRAAVELLRDSLCRRRPERGPAGDMREAIDLIVAHLDRHGHSLWGHVIPVPAGGTRLVARTNVLLESFFHEWKHGERRRSGRKILTQDLEQLPAAALLASNLRRPDYIEILCGTLGNLSTAFAELDTADRSLSLPARLRAEGNGDTDIVSASLPKVDRLLVRGEPLCQRVAAEAAARAPRRKAA